MGLLDKFANLDETQTQGLLAAASQMLQNSGPSRTPVGFGQIVGSGLEAYQGSTLAAKRRKMEEEQAALQKQVMGLTIRDKESDFKAQQDKRAYMERLSSHLSGMPQVPREAAQAAVPQLSSVPQASYPGIVPPQASMPARPDPFKERMARAEYLRQGGFHSEADAAEVEALKFREELRTVDNGQTNDMVNPFTGEVKASLKKAQTLESLASERSAAAGRAQSDRHFQANYGLAKERFNFDRREAGSGGKAPAGYRWSANGQELEPIPGGPASKGAVATEGERKAATLVQRLQSSQQQLRDALDPTKNGDPKAAKPSILSEGLRAMKGGEVFANSLNSAQRQRVEAAQLDILDAGLTLATGAAYTREQLEGYRKSYFPQIGDDKTTIKDKEQRLMTMIEAGRTQAGRAAPSPAAAQPAKTIKRTGTYGGRKVVEYTDGSTEYAN